MKRETNKEYFKRLTLLAAERIKEIRQRQEDTHVDRFKPQEDQIGIGIKGTNVRFLQKEDDI